MNVEPIFAPLVTKGRLALCNLICVVGEGVVYTAAMNVEVFAEVLTCNAGALDMPAGIAKAPRRHPFKLLVIKLGLCKPKNEVSLIALVAILLNAVADTYCEVVLGKVVEDIILLKL